MARNGPEPTFIPDLSPACASVSQVVDALAGRAGSRLKELTIVVHGSRADAMVVVDRLTDVIYDGGLPAFASSPGRKAPAVSFLAAHNEPSIRGSSVGKAELEEAVRRVGR